jgi:hypothetical protein
MKQKNRNSIYCTALIGLIIAPFMSSAQSNMGSTFYRPSVSIVYSALGTKNENTIFQKMDELGVPSRFDYIKIEHNKIQYKHPVPPELPEDINPLELKSVMSEYRVQKKKYEEQLELLTKTSLKEAARDIVAGFWGRDNNGNFNFDGVLEKAKYSATDSEANISGLSSDKGKIYTDIADSLLKRKYVFIYEITNVKTYEEHYNQLDASAKRTAAKNGTEFKAVERKQEGWLVDYDAFIYKLDWNDSVNAVFYDELWLDSSVESDRAERINKFNNFEFPLKRVYSLSSVATVGQSNDPEYYEKPLAPKRKKMNELLDKIPNRILSGSFESVMTGIDDFKLRAPLTDAYPNLVKLGVKEGLNFDQRFFVYRQELKKDKTIKKRIGVLRVADIADNSGVATGESDASKLRQQGGKRLYGGDLVESAEDFGLSVYLGYTANDALAGGGTFGLDYRLSDLYNKKFMRGLYLNAFINYNLSKNERFFADDVVNTLFFGQNRVDMESISGSLGISRETYLTKRGNIYVMPEFGAGAILLTASSESDNDPIFESVSGMSLFAYGALSIGYHFSPSVSLYIKPMFNSRLGFDVWTSEPEYDDTNEAIGLFDLNNQGSWALANSTGIPVFAGIRIKL